MIFFCLVFATLDRPRVVPRHNRDQLGLGIQGSGFRVQGSGFRVQGSGFKFQRSGFRAQDCCKGLSRSEVWVAPRGNMHTDGSEEGSYVRLIDFCITEL